MLPPAVPAAAPLRPVADLSPKLGYLARELELLPRAAPLTGEEDVALLQRDQPVRARTSDLIAMVRQEVNEKLSGDALQARGGGGRHTFERSAARAPRKSPGADDVLVVVRDGQTITYTVDQVSAFIYDIVQSIFDQDDDQIVDNSERLGGQLPAYYQVADPLLYAISALITSADKLAYFTGSDAVSQTDLTAYGRSWLAAVNASAAKLLLALVKADVGLGNVDNTSDVNKPVSTAQQTALELKANLASPDFTGNPTAPTQTAGNNTTRLATTAFVSTAIGNLVAGAPGLLDTLDELAAALGDDPNFATTVATSLSGKLTASNNLSDVANAATARTNLGLGNVDNTSDATKWAATKTLTNTTYNAAGTGNVLSNIATSMFAASVVDNDANLAANSATRIPTQQALSGALASRVSVVFSNYTAKASVVDADGLPINDSAASNALKSTTFAAVKAWIKSWIVKADVGLGNVANVDQTNGSNILSGTVAASRVGQIALGSSGNGGVGGALPVANGGTGVIANPTISVVLTADQSVPTATFTRINFNQELIDNNSNYDNATNFRFQPNVAGNYQLNVRLFYRSVGAGKTVQVYAYKNGSPLIGNEQYVASAGNQPVILATIIQLNGSTDYVDVRAYHDNGSSLDIRSGGYSTFEAYRAS